jgi:hypothetical protein
VSRQGASAVVFAAVASATAPSNDDFAAAQTVPAEGGTLDGSNMDSSAQTGEPAHGGSPYGALHSIWYRWTPPADGEKAKAKLKITFTDEAGNSDNQKLTLKLR